jgi:subtilisin family serine protease
LLHKDPDIEWAEPVFIYKTGATPDDPIYDTEQEDYLELINLENAWEISTGSSDVVVAVIDSGVNYDHEDLENNIWANPGEELNGEDDDDNGFIDDIRGWDFVDIDEDFVISGEDSGPADNDPMDFGGHGTHVAGIIGAQGNNSLGVTGVSWNVRIMPLRAGYYNTSNQGVVSYAPEALNYACNNGADIVNMSFGFPGPTYSYALMDAIDDCVEKGVLLIAGAGNSDSSITSYPAGYEDVIAVAAIYGYKNKIQKAGFSNFGIWVDIAAPGVGIYSTWVDDSNTTNNNYKSIDGTSMAAPIVSGIAALLKSAKPELTAYELSRHLYAYSRNISEDEPDYHMDLGAGLVQAVLDKETSDLPGMVKVVSLR